MIGKTVVRGHTSGEVYNSRQQCASPIQPNVSNITDTAPPAVSQDDDLQIEMHCCPFRYALLALARVLLQCGPPHLSDSHCSSGTM
jgi:hypothetical protein